jgi:hypothetical protein
MHVTDRLHTDESTLHTLAEDIKSRNRVVKQYIHFDSIAEMVLFIRSKQDAITHLYEVIDGMQRLYLDIDIPNPDKDYTADVFLLKDYICHIYTDAQVNIYSSHREGKQSFHLIVKNKYVYDNVQCKHHIQYIKDNCGLDIATYIDMTVYKRFQLLRLVGASKLDTENRKVLMDGTDGVEDSLVTYRDDAITAIPDVDIEYNIPSMAFYARRRRR